MKNSGTKTESRKRYSEKKKWTSPGSLIFTGVRKVENLRIHLLSYDKTGFDTKEISNPDELNNIPRNGRINWINVTGLHDTLKLHQIAELFNIHPLVTEDILNTSHSPKYENYIDYIFLIAKMIDFNPEKKLNIEQVSFILGKNYLITFQEDEEDLFNMIRNRIENNIGRIRSNGVDYLLYRLLDAIVDGYYTIVERMEDDIDAIDDSLTAEKQQISLEPIYHLRKDIMRLRRAVFPLKETIHAIERERDTFISKSTYLFIRDLNDHLRYISDSIENNREMITSMIEVHMSFESHRLNEVIKLLTMISTIFIPLTFIVGVYGMNFNTQVSRWNMPELNWGFGYPLIWLIMITISFGLILFFKRKKWF